MLALPNSIMKPARYLGIEPNRITKEPGKDDIRCALCYPDIYEIGMSYYGLALLYEVMNNVDGVWCERCFAPWHDMETYLKKEGIELFTLESRTPLNRMDVVGFSLGCRTSGCWLPANCGSAYGLRRRPALPEPPRYGKP